MCPSQHRLSAQNGQVHCLRAVGRQMHGGEVEGANDGHVDNVLGMVKSSLPRSRCRVHRPRSRTDGRRLCEAWSWFSWRGTRKAARRDRLERPGGWKARRSSTVPLVERSAFPAGHVDRSHQELDDLFVLLHEVVRVLTRTSHAGVGHYHCHGISCFDEVWLRSSTWKASWS